MGSKITCVKMYSDKMKSVKMNIGLNVAIYCYTFERGGVRICHIVMT